jgi:hypothetical protein
LPVPTPIGLEKDGAPLIRPFCPPYYPTMADAARAFVDVKFAEGKGVFRDGGAATAWQDGAAIQSGIPAYPDRVVDAVIAYCTYVFGRYGRFPSASGPFRTVLAYQAHRLDAGFYEKFYRPDALETARPKP